jgi:hypothetical protein
VNGVTPKPKRCQLQTLVKLREFIGRLLFGPPSLEHDGRAQITVTQTAERHAPGTSDPDTSLPEIDLRLVAWRALDADCRELRCAPRATIIGDDARWSAR